MNLAVRPLCRTRRLTLAASTTGRRSLLNRPYTRLSADAFSKTVKSSCSVQLVQKRLNQQLATQTPKAPPIQTPKASNPPSQDLGGEPVHISQSEQRKNDWNIVKRLAENIWPKNDWSTRGRVLFGFGLLVAGKASVGWDSRDWPCTDFVSLAVECPSPTDVQADH